jgi:hypothetical protein
MYSGIVFCVTNRLNGKRYIGTTTRTLQYVHRRFNGDRDSYRNGPIFRAIQEIGPERFGIGKLAGASSKRELLELKLSFMERFDTISPNGYNERIPARPRMTSVVCIERNVIFETALQAAESIPSDEDSMFRAIQSRGTLGGYHWEFFKGKHARTTAERGLGSKR